MKKLLSALGLMVALSLGAIAWIGMPVSGVLAGETIVPGAQICAAATALDQGYGVSRSVETACERR